MKRITIQNQTANSLGWQYSISVENGGDTVLYTINLDQDYYQRLTHGKIESSALARFSVEFLIRKNRIGAFSKAINIRAIAELLPEFEREIQADLKRTCDNESHNRS